MDEVQKHEYCVESSSALFRMQTLYFPNFRLENSVSEFFYVLRKILQFHSIKVDISFPLSSLTVLYCLWAFEEEPTNLSGRLFCLRTNQLQIRIHIMFGIWMEKKAYFLFSAKFLKRWISQLFVYDSSIITIYCYGLCTLCAVCWFIHFFTFCMPFISCTFFYPFHS